MFCNTEIGRLDLSYKITVTQHGGKNYYGVSVTSVDESGATDVKTVNDVTSDIKIAEELVNKLYSGAVTPVTLEDIISDFMELIPCYK